MSVDRGDFRPFSPMPEEYETATIWSGVDEIFFRPLTKVFSFDASKRALNVHAMDEVPDSSWFTNRMSGKGMTPEEVQMGSCQDMLSSEGPFEVLGGKPDGFNPGFLVLAPNGKRYFFKFDYTESQPERASLADVVGSRIYHAAGFYAPCNQIIYFARSALKLSPKATKKDAKGENIPMTDADVQEAFKLAKLDPDGRVRASASLFLEGKPLGPWQYAGTRSDDLNDVIPHEHRRELRAGFVIASWVNHFDTRDQNTLAMWIPTAGGKGYVRHNIIDFGDSFGNLANLPNISNRLGYSYYLDFEHVFEDWLTFGFWVRPWDEGKFGKAGPVLGYYNVWNFEADEWQPGYPNPAFAKMREDDAAWMARIIAEFTPAHIQAAVRAGNIQNTVVRSELARILRGRQMKILRRWFRHQSPLTQPKFDFTKNPPQICLKDLAVYSGISKRLNRRYSVRGWMAKPALKDLGKFPVWPPKSDAGRVCGVLPTQIPGHDPSRPSYLMVDFTAKDEGQLEPPLIRIHLYVVGKGKYRVVGIERPETSVSPFE